MHHMILAAAISTTVSACAGKSSAVQPNKGDLGSTHVATAHLPDGFVYLDEIDPSILVELRYAGKHNFVGRPIPGYSGNRAVMTRQAAEGLRHAQALARTHGMTLKIYDAYRPEKATAAFVAWSQDLSDQKMKAEFFPHLDKTRIFPEGYVSPCSAHSRGSTIDLTLVPLPVTANEDYVDGQPLRSATAPYHERWRDNSIDMGTGFDAFDALANTANAGISTEAQANRKLLLKMMGDCGFDNYPKEWWHFTLRDEPFPDTRFDFDL